MATRKKSWNDITVSDFQAIYKLESEDPEDRLLRLIALVNGIGYDDVLNMPISELERHFGDIDFLQREPRIPLMRGSYELGGTRYRVHSKEMTTAQYIDFKQMVDSYAENLARFLTIFLIPEGHRYGDGYDLDKAAQDISSMSITDARSVADFFLTACALLTAISLRSSRRQIRRRIRRARTQGERELLGRMMAEVESLRHTIGSTLWRR